MSLRHIVMVSAIAISSATGSVAQSKPTSSTASTMINGRRIFAHTDKGSASIATAGGAAMISISGHKIKVEKARITLDNQMKPIAPTAKRVEVDARGGKVIISVDHKVLFNQGR